MRAKDDELNRKICWTTGLVLLAAIAAALIMANFSVGCARVRVCEPGTMHCLGSRAELCDQRGRWRQVMDCATVEPKAKVWRCCCQGDKAGRCSCQVAP